MRGCDQASTSIILLQAPLMDASRQDPSSFFSFGRRWVTYWFVSISPPHQGHTFTRWRILLWQHKFSWTLINPDKFITSCVLVPEQSAAGLLSNTVFLFFFVLLPVEIVDGFVLVIPSKPPSKSHNRCAWSQTSVHRKYKRGKWNKPHRSVQNSFAFISHVRLVKCPLKNVYRWEVSGQNDCLSPLTGPIRFIPHRFQINHMSTTMMQRDWLCVCCMVNLVIYLLCDSETSKLLTWVEWSIELGLFVFKALSALRECNFTEYVLYYSWCVVTCVY